ncbi:replication endonuclease [Psychromonas hadalis]|uniref:replication endonuclease n=1 Tax=Psychromonas hadalis TaxID=211669 RepID=UPI000416D673|nr:replication endonuclease [Psychromonas hadalis]
MEHEIKRTQAVDSKYREQRDYLNDLNDKFKYYRAEPQKALLNEQANQQWFIDKKWAVTELVETMPRELATSVFKQYVKKWEKYVLANGSARSANIWLRKRVEKTRVAVSRFPVPIDNLYFESGRKAQANIWCDKCVQIVTECAEKSMSIAETKEFVVEIAKQWGFAVKKSTEQIERQSHECDDEFELRKADELAWFEMLRLLDEQWWLRKIDVAFRQYYEHCQIINGRVHQGSSRYLSCHGLTDFRARKTACEIALSQMLVVNSETGEEMEMSDVVKASIANPELRRNELMLRLRGFENIADENGLIAGFYTLTAPSKFHAYNKRKNGKGAYLNKNYKGASPRTTQTYLCGVWAKARAKLKRLDIEIIGFRVCEPHHDGTPHWHALFFFHPEDEQIIRFVLADYFTQEDRSELNVSDDEFQLWGKIIGGDDSQVDLFDIEKIRESENLIKNVAERIKARFLYEKIDKDKGSATGYLAKYIAKNIDGFKVDDEEGKPANKSAELACGWSSTWRIRQFQQIGGPPVSVWRELRRLEQDKEVAEAKAKAKKEGVKYEPKIRSLIDIQSEHDPVEIARIAADLGNWSMYIEAMGGLFCKRAGFPVGVVYKQVENAYGESVKKLKAVGCSFITMISRSDGWSIVKKNATKEGFDPKASASAALGVLSLTVREQQIIKQGRQLGVSIDGPTARILDAGGSITLKTRVVKGEKRVEKMKMVKTYLDVGGDQLQIWEESVDIDSLHLEYMINGQPDKKGRVNDLQKLREALRERKGNMQILYLDTGWRTTVMVKNSVGAESELTTVQRLEAVQAWADENKVRLIKAKQGGVF